MPHRQEVLNVILAELLNERGLDATPETVLTGVGGERRLPDVLVDFQGLRLAIEAEFASQPGAFDKAYNKALDRVVQGIAHIGVAVVYPVGLRTVSFEAAKETMAAANLHFTVVTEADITTQRDTLFPAETAPAFSSGSVDDLVESLKRTYGQLVRDDALAIAVNLLQERIEALLNATYGQPGTIGRLAEALGATKPPARGNDKKAVGQRKAVVRIAGLVIVNAMMFQEVLTRGEARVRPLSDFGDWPDAVPQLVEHWQFILDRINYYPIFFTACSLLRCLAADHRVSRAVENLAHAALRIVGWRVSLRHDLAGRIYHRILEEAKYLGAYYTSIPSATLLLKLATPSVVNDWSNLDAVADLKVADLACGTGTLLMAFADAAADNYIRASVKTGGRLDLDRLHRLLVERVIHGYDVLASAIHLTASTLTLRVPDSPINVTNLYRLLLGGPGLALGTLEFLAARKIRGDLFSRPEQVTGTGRHGDQPVELPTLDMCVMNPPFTRSVGGNLLFGNFSGPERESMQKRLRNLVRETGLPANITAGLGQCSLLWPTGISKREARYASSSRGPCFRALPGCRLGIFCTSPTTCSTSFVATTHRTGTSPKTQTSARSWLSRANCAKARNAKRGRRYS